MNQRRQGLCSWGLSFNLICWKCRLKINIWSTKLIGGCWWRRWLPFRQIGSDDCWSWSDMFCEWFTTAADGNKALFGNDPKCDSWSGWEQVANGKVIAGHVEHLLGMMWRSRFEVTNWFDRTFLETILDESLRIFTWKYSVSNHNLSRKISRLFWFWHWSNLDFKTNPTQTNNPNRARHPLRSPHKLSACHMLFGSL